MKRFKIWTKTQKASISKDTDRAWASVSVRLLYHTYVEYTRKFSSINEKFFLVK
jgi:hypothetical protein